GVGYNFQVGYCYPLITESYGNTNFKVSVTQDLKTTTIPQYKTNDKQCTSPNPSTTKTYTNGTCIQVPNYTDSALSMNVNGENEGNYVLVNIVENPKPPSLFGTKVATYGDPECESTPWFYYYYVNGTLFNNQPSNYQNTLIYCQEDRPLEKTCYSNGDCKTTSLMTGCKRDIIHW
ncbi:hypothetical protein DICPUDRAFT_21341, partial [Dictyostelium purpureum]